MTYRCATRGLGHIGIPDGEAQIVCDGCGAVLEARTESGGPPMWLLNRKAPPGWKLIRTEEPFTREDYCPRCRTTTPLSSKEPKSAGGTEGEGKKHDPSTLCLCGHPWSDHYRPGYSPTSCLFKPDGGSTPPGPSTSYCACESFRVSPLMSLRFPPPPASATEGKLPPCHNGPCCRACDHDDSDAACTCFPQPAPSSASEVEKSAAQDDAKKPEHWRSCPKSLSDWRSCNCPVGASERASPRAPLPGEVDRHMRDQHIAALESELAAAREEAKRLRLSLMEVRGWAEQDLKRESGRYEIGGLEQHRVDQALSGWLERVKRIEAALSVSP